VKKIVAAFGLAGYVLLASIATDAFTDTNGVDLEAHTMTSGGLTWDCLSTTVLEVQSNKAAPTGIVGWEQCIVNASDASVLIEADIDVPSADDAVYGIAVRVTDESNGWWVDLIRQSAGNWRMRLNERNASTETTRDEDTDVGAIGGTTVNVVVTANGNTITGYLNDVQTVTYASASFNNTETKHGLTLYSGSPYSLNGRWDNFSIDSDPTFGGGAASFIPGIINAPIRGGGRVRRR
jgi:hypothetical protein